MSKRPNPPLRPRPLASETANIGLWIRALGLTPAEVSRLGEINEGYLSQLISGDAKDPRLSYLRKIAGVLGISVSTMLRPPPDQAMIDRFAGLDASVIVRLRRGPPREN